MVSPNQTRLQTGLRSLLFSCSKLVERVERLPQLKDAEY